MKSVFFCPVFNEIHSLPQFLERLRSAPLACDEFLLFNNGSTDGSERLVRDSGFPYLEVERNRGSGYSFMRAIDWALERDFEVIGSIASNGKMDPLEMSRVLSPVLLGEADYVTGSRFLPGGESPNLPRFRRGAIPLVNRYVQFVTGARLTDSTCGYRAMRLDLFRRARFDWHAPWLQTYGIESYLYAQVLLDGGVRWREVPVTMAYPSSDRSYSKIRPSTDWWAILRPWLVARADRLGFEPRTQSWRAAR